MFVIDLIHDLFFRKVSAIINTIFDILYCKLIVDRVLQIWDDAAYLILVVSIEKYSYWLIIILFLLLLPICFCEIDFRVLLFVDL